MSPEVPEVRFVTRPAELTALLGAMKQARYLPLDTEFIRERTYFPQLALLQIATDEAVWLVDPVAELDLTPFWQTLAATTTPVVLHAGDQDLDLILSAAGSLPQRVFDTQIAAELLGIGAQMSYAALTESLLGVSLDKAVTRSNWLARPLSPRQLDYAAQDVAQLHALYPTLYERLASQDRLDWMIEESSRQLEPGRFSPDDDRRWKKVRGVQTLSRAGLSVLRSLAAYRERLARELDRPRRWVWGDQAMLDLAHAISRLAPPLTADMVVREISRAGSSPLSRDADARQTLAETIAATLSGDPAEWP
ncbi:MAG TPA: HRDC domain-containing protein, partial [Guyparkeria sp.]|nr:HRDC domain-containing protein [Guyparkeria sp.]